MLLIAQYSSAISTNGQRTFTLIKDRFGSEYSISQGLNVTKVFRIERKHGRFMYNAELKDVTTHDVLASVRRMPTMKGMKADFIIGDESGAMERTSSSWNPLSEYQLIWRGETIKIACSLLDNEFIWKTNGQTIAKAVRDNREWKLIVTGLLAQYPDPLFLITFAAVAQKER